MEKPQLKLPEVTVLSPNKLDPKPKELKAWLDNLPLGDANASATIIIKMLNSYNSCYMSSSERLIVLNHISAIAQELLKTLQNKYRDSAFPLSDRNRVRCDHVNQLLDEMANGFKWMVHTIIEDWNRKSSPNPELFEVIRIAMVYLSRRLMSAYTTYAVEPEGVWKDLHQLYYVVDHFRHDLDPGKHRKMLADIRVVEATYLRIVMLSITNPFHLMQGEAQLIFNYLNKWVEGCNVVRIDGAGIQDGDLLIDLESDYSPKFIYSKELEHSRNCRSVEMKMLMERFHAAVDALTTRKGKALKNVKLSFNERMRRDMLIRLRNVWVGRLKRNEERKPMTDNVQLVAGLSACHFFADDEKDFYPESDEIQIYKPQKKDYGLSLMTEDMEDWQFNDEKTHISAETQRLSRFNSHADVWEQAFASKSHARALMDANAVKHQAFTWQRRNVSEHGMGLRNISGDNAKLTVGSIVSFHPDGEEKKWQLGMVTWLEEFAPNQLDMGIQYIMGMPLPVAARAISGTGGGSEYFRALLFKAESDQHVAKIIVPAGMYDVGTQIVLNFRKELRYVRLTDMVKTSTSCTMFGFHEIEIPIAEQTKINKIKSA